MGYRMKKAALSPAPLQFGLEKALILQAQGVPGLFSEENHGGVRR